MVNVFQQFCRWGRLRTFFKPGRLVRAFKNFTVVGGWYLRRMLEMLDVRSTGVGGAENKGMKKNIK